MIDGPTWVAGEDYDALWDACVAEGHGPDAWARTCRGPQRDDDPCPVCAEMVRRRKAAEALDRELAER